MKAVLYTSVALVVALMLAGCGYLSDPTGTPDSSPLIPQDVVRDVSRGDDFAFETFVSVGLDLEVSILESEGERVPGDDTLVVVTVRNPQGDELFQAPVQPDGSLKAQFGVATATPAVTLILEGPGLDTRRLTVDDPAELATIRRSMQVTSYNGVGIAVAASVDTDKDGVPDIYDADPDNKNVGWETLFPADGSRFFTVAYEDNFPNLGDGDYNDFVASYDVTVRGAGDYIVLVRGTAYARAKVAGYDHEFGLMFRIPNATGQLYTTLNGETVLDGEDFSSGEIRVPLFSSTTTATSGGVATATFSISFDLPDPDGGITGALRDDMPPAPFDPYLYVKNTNYDVHLIDELPLPELAYRHDPKEDFRDAAGFPRALLVPSEFKPPKEITSILLAYPRFEAWAAEDGGLDGEGQITSNWYLFPEADFVMDVPSIP